MSRAIIVSIYKNDPQINYLYKHTWKNLHNISLYEKKKDEDGSLKFFDLLV